MPKPVTRRNALPTPAEIARRCLEIRKRHGDLPVSDEGEKRLHAVRVTGWADGEVEWPISDEPNTVEDALVGALATFVPSKRAGATP